MSACPLGDVIVFEGETFAGNAFKVKTSRSHESRLTVRPLDQDFGLWDLSDDSLVRVRRALLRETSDLARDGRIKEAQRKWHEAAEIRAHQLMRFRLKMRWGAVDEHLGTYSYDCWYRHGEPPVYYLAGLMDRANQIRGLRHAVDWPVTS